MLHESDEDETTATKEWLADLAQKREEVKREKISEQVKEQGIKLGLDMSVIEHIETKAHQSAMIVAKTASKKRTGGNKKHKVQQQ